jgi:protein MpaA
MNSKQFFVPTVCALFMLLVLAGCYKPVNDPVMIDVPQTDPAVQHSIVGTSVQNRPIECFVLGQGRDVTFILATIHGDEPAGTPLVRKLAKYILRHRQLLQGRKVVLLPVANPDGMAYNSRFNARGVDLNRNFATANRHNTARFGNRALSEPEARAINRLIRQYAPDRIVSIHQPLACIDYDGPAEALAGRMAEYCDLPVRKLGARPGSLGSYAGLTLGIPIITLELPQYAERLDSETLWERYGRAVIAAVVYPDSLE